MLKLNKKFDVVVIGGGHAGCEAIAAASRLGARAALVTPSSRHLGLQPCNPAIGGPGKGHLVREITALGGLMGRIADQSGLQFRTLNKAKGPAVQSTRVQTDSRVYMTRMREAIGQLAGVTIVEGFAGKIRVEKKGGRRRILGITMEDGSQIDSTSVVVTTGTYLQGVLFVGDKTTPGGRRDAQPSIALAQSLSELGLPMIRLKTGTCPRLLGESIDFSSLEAQKGDSPPPFFHPETTSAALPQRTCHITYTNHHTHDLISRNLGRSAMYNGLITGIGPRYCPSIETKIERFPDKDKHQIFLEPEDQQGRIIYPAGLSTSFPKKIQEQMVHAIAGLEKAQIIHYGYAVEYDAFEPQYLSPHLESTDISGLFLAGQILGTSGYEEAAATGLLAGANAVLCSRSEPPLVFGRNEAYMGVMVDDLTGKGVDEPYRMFTSRAEYRLLLREDNAEERLFPEAVRTGLLPSPAAKRVGAKLARLNEARQSLREGRLTPSRETNQRLTAAGLDPIDRPFSLFELARRELNQLDRVFPFAPRLADLDTRSLSQLAAEIKYDGYLVRQQTQAKRLKEIDTIAIPPQMEMTQISGLRGEVIEKLKRHRPATLGQVSRIPGITPAAVEILRVYITKYNKEKIKSNNDI